MSETRMYGNKNSGMRIFVAFFLVTLMVSGLATGSVHAVIVSIGEAVDNTAYTFTTGGSASWYGQTTTSYYSGDSAQSGLIGNGQTSWLSLQTGYASWGTYVRFVLKVSSEAGYDKLSVYINGDLVDSISGEVDWQTKAYFLPGGGTIEWTYTKDGSGSAGADAGWVDHVEVFKSWSNPMIDAAVDNSALTWQTFYSGSAVAGEGPWHGEPFIYTYGGSAAQSGRVSTDSVSYLRTDVTGPGTLSFWWKVSSGSGDYLSFSIDGVSQNSISGNVDWQQKTYTISSGAHTLQWNYDKDAYSATDAGMDAGFLDKVEFTSSVFSATIWGWDYISGWGTPVPISIDGVSTGSSTPHTFTGLSGTHTFTAPSTDASGHTFYQWSTGSTSRTLTISAAGVYTARYKPITTALTVTSPKGGNSWVRGTAHMITWTSTGSPGANVKIELLKGGGVNRVISSSTANDGSYSWTIPTTQTAGTDYKIRITSTTNAAITDSSNANFAITIGALTVTSPNGGNSWVHGTAHTITWTSSGSPGTYVKIELLKAGSVNRVISASTANDGSYSWSIPATQGVGTDYKIRITSTTNTAITDSSNSNFSIII